MLDACINPINAGIKEGKLPWYRFLFYSIYIYCFLDFFRYNRKTRILIGEDVPDESVHQTVIG